MWATPLAAVWPPALRLGLGPDENSMWELELKGEGSEEIALRVIAQRLEPLYNGALFAKVCGCGLGREPLLIAS